MRDSAPYTLYCLALIFFLCFEGLAQSNEQKALEAKRNRLQKEIREINRLLFDKKKERGNVLDQMDALDKKINTRQQLIRVTNQQSNLLNRQINANIRSVSKLRSDLRVLKEDYAKLVQQSYQNRAQNNRVLFLLSSQNFYQAYKRFQYLKQYAEHRKIQGNKIKTRTEKLLELNRGLTEQRKNKERLLADNVKIKNELSREILAQKELLHSIRDNESKYTAAIAAKEKERKRINREIDRLIKRAIASSNERAGKANSTKFELTPEYKLVADNFISNKGRLIWPVAKGIKSQGFGVYSDKVYPGIKHQNNGVTIATEEGEKARAIFEGEVITIFTNKMGIKGVYIRHGNYISMYYNLSKTYVQKGDKVAAKEILGDVYTNRSNGTTKLKFYLYEDTNKLNPEEWIYQL
ncbi:MAG: peptidoglycan DD-metalloendopeptidase family protein [Bacteroidota bacterium]